MSDRKPPVHRCIRCDHYRFDNETWETATLRSGGIGYNEIESICHRCVPEVVALLQPHLDRKRDELEAKARERMRAIVSEPEFVGKFQPREEAKFRVEPRAPAVGQVWEALPSEIDDCGGHRCVIGDVKSDCDTVYYRWITGLRNPAGEAHLCFALSDWHSGFRYIGGQKDEEPEDEDILRKLW